MPKKPSKQERAYEFRHLLGTDLAAAESILREHPFVLDHPVYGNSESAVHYFATGNQHEIVSWLMAHGANPNGIAEDDFPIHVAAQLGHLETVKVLAESGAKLDARDDSGETALHKASCGGHLDVIDFLLQAGADPSISEMGGQLPIDQASPGKAEEVRARFCRHAASSSKSAQNHGGGQAVTRPESK
jgi:ankyrin repeat protein